jgi:hypothetical protein
VDVAVRVLGPEWTRATRVMLFANGEKIREEEIAPRGKDEPAGVKWEGKWVLPQPKQDVWLVAMATGPGVEKPYWAMAKPYQPVSTAWTSYVMGSSGAVWVDADGSGKFESPHEYAVKIVEGARGEMKYVVRALGDYDEATAAQAAGVLWRREPQDFEQKLNSAMEGGAAPVRGGFEAFLNDLAQTHASPAPH